MEYGPLIGRGRCAEVYAWDDNRVLKLFYPGFWRPAIEAEAAGGKAAYDAKLPTPQVYDVIERDGRTGIVFERISGPTMLHVLRSKPWQVVSIARQLADLHASMHACHLSTLPSRRDLLRVRIQRSATKLSDKVLNAALKSLESLPDGDAVLHGDFHPDNIILTERGPMIIDWMDATRGDPLADVARTVMLMSLGEPPDTSRPMKMIINMLRATLRGTYIRHYCALRGVTQNQIDAWMLPTTAARLDEGNMPPAEEKRVFTMLEIECAPK